jgi:hypothetical protein
VAKAGVSSFGHRSSGEEIFATKVAKRSDSPRYDRRAAASVFIMCLLCGNVECYEVWAQYRLLVDQLNDQFGFEAADRYHWLLFGTIKSRAHLFSTDKPLQPHLYITITDEFVRFDERKSVRKSASRSSSLRGAVTAGAARGRGSRGGSTSGGGKFTVKPKNKCWATANNMKCEQGAKCPWVSDHTS